MVCQACSRLYVRVCISRHKFRTIHVYCNRLRFNLILEETEMKLLMGHKSLDKFMNFTQFYIHIYIPLHFTFLELRYVKHAVHTHFLTFLLEHSFQ